MNIIEIKTLPNGAHRNQSGGNVLPDGWAVIPDGMEMQNFPFGEVVVEDVAGVPTVTGWTPGIVPEPDPEPPAEDTALETRVAALEEEAEQAKIDRAALTYLLTGEETV